MKDPISQDSENSQDMHTRTHCPTCGTVLELTLRCKSMVVVDGKEPPVPDIPAPPVHSQAERVVIAAAHRVGLFDPFVQVVTAVKHDQVPKDLEGFFLTFLRGLRQRLIPQYAMTAFNRLFDRQPLEYHTSQGIGVVIVNGYLRLFVPNDQVVGTRVRSLASGSATTAKRTLKIDDGAEKLDAWIRTRWGYVEGPGALFDEMHKRSFGDFARPSLSAPAPHRT